MALRYLFSLALLLFTLDCYYGQDWQDWNAWAACTATCGTGTTTRTRGCAGPTACTGHTMEHGNCHHANLCMWGEWGDYGSCSVSCGTGVLTRFRDCDNGNITTNLCVGSNNATTPCMVQACPHWDPWTAWTPCPVTCGSTGVISRSRTCNGTGECVGNSTESGPCNPVPANCPGVWTEWGNLPCSKTCGAGTQIRTRICPPPGGCFGEPQDAVACNLGECPAVTQRPVGVWGQWSEWGNCSKTCGRGGRRSRTRTCVGAQTCPGAPSDESRCGKLGRCRGRRQRRCRGRRCPRRRRN